MPTGLHPDTLEHLVTGLTISSIALYTNPESVHIFLQDGTRHAGILTLTATDDGLNVALDNPPEMGYHDGDARKSVTEE